MTRTKRTAAPVRKGEHWGSIDAKRAYEINHLIAQANWHQLEPHEQDAVARILERLRAGEDVRKLFLKKVPGRRRKPGSTERKVAIAFRLAVLQERGAPDAAGQVADWYGFSDEKTVYDIAREPEIKEAVTAIMANADEDQKDKALRHTPGPSVG